jgi:hypothetical protein
MILLSACLAQAAQDFTPPSAVTLKSAMERRKARQAFLRGVKKRAATRSTDEWGERNHASRQYALKRGAARAFLAARDSTTIEMLRLLFCCERGNASDRGKGKVRRPSPLSSDLSLPALRLFFH